MEIKNVIFDLGKVLIDFNFSSFWESIGAEKCERFLDEAQEPILLFEAGKISKQQFLNEIQTTYNFDMNMQDFEKIWCDVFSEKSQMIEMAKKINKKYEIFIFSNTDEIHFPYIWKKFPSIHFFKENLMLSYEIGSVKPDLDSYERALNKFDLKFEECLFIDDRPINIQVAESLGMKGILHKEYEDTKERISEILDMTL
ncbi:MAG: HAD family phosphatase [Armatimonadetes bacterium]|nr:HAD family phosphatase [Armatimonadota bacterium]